MLPRPHRGPVTVVFLKLTVLGSETELALEVCGWSWIPSGQMLRNVGVGCGIGVKWGGVNDWLGWLGASVGKAEGPESPLQGKSY